ncbi:MAG: hypothetical protein KJ645_03210 [Planctomycetes bacterium]|nr:hypothetical protein [Planctomycetota bacterium]
MGACLCSIFDTREERLVEEDGRIVYRLICNICGSILDSRIEFDGLAFKKNQESRGEKESGATAF